MKQSLEHLPPHKQEQLEAIVRVIREHASPEMVILYGSHARGTWQDDPAHGFHSDYDLLVLVRRPSIVHKSGLWFDVQRLARRHSGWTPISIIVHTVKEMNEALREGAYFFVDVYDEGILLHDSGRSKLVAPRPMAPERRVERAQEIFERYFDKANAFYDYFEFGFARDENETAAFLLHQAAEHYYKGMLLVFTAYQPKEHSLKDLGEKCCKVDEAMRDIFPMGTPEDRARFELLESAYVDARYSMTYSISREDLEILSGQVRALRSRAEHACRAHIDALAAGVTPANPGQLHAP
jgi:uncharacterized protein